MQVQSTAITTDRIWTIPNILSLGRLIGIPVFLWLLLVAQADGWAIALLVVSGATDWFDGVIARRTGQISRLGELLDPLADRLYIVATLAAFGIRGIIPWILVIILLGRDVVLAIMLIPLKRRGIVGLPVHFLGKAATANLLLAFPLLLLGAGSAAWAPAADAFGWALVLWGTALYLYAAALYLVQSVRLLRTVPAGG